jgi:glycosyltransferase involved in cell wall biosynthesis
VAFNSPFHRWDFLEALRALSEQPNNWLDPAGIDRIAVRAEVVPVGVDFSWLDALRPDQQGAREQHRPPLLLWNHRWEFDKAPEMFARVVRRLAGEGVSFRLALAGEPGVNPSPALTALARDLGERVIHAGHATRDDYGRYGRLLWSADVVASTTRHEFFGVGMVEALYCGCFPVAPNRFNYPALVPELLQGRCLYDDEAGFERLLKRALEQRDPREDALRASAIRFSWSNVAPLWDAFLARLANA